MNRPEGVAYHPAMPLALALLLLLLSGCAKDDAASGEPEAPAIPARERIEVPYALAEPDARLTLAPRLREISGLTVLEGGTLAAVQDEDGDVFELDPASGEILSEQRFYNSGDYEGIERAGDTLWVVESDGDLYRITGADEAEKFETGLKRSNDVEGLAYDARGHRLLLACKGDPGGGLDGVRAIYAYDLASGTLSEGPLLTLDREALDRASPFKPSGLAVHPLSGEVYVISGVLTALVVLAPDGDLRAAVALPPRLFPQPEGIAFSPDGTLFISNEGGSGSATLLRFSPQPQS